MMKKIISRLKLRTWVSIGIIVVLGPMVLLAVYGVLGARGGSLAVPSNYWALDEGVDNTCSGGTNDACDSVGGKDASFDGGTAFINEESCISGKCLYFDGTDDQASLPTATVPSGAFSISLWVKPQGTSHQHIYWQQETEIRFLANNTINARLYNGSDTYSVTTTETFAKNQWQHIVFTYDESSVYLFVNGTLRATTNASGNAASSTGYWGRDETTNTRLKGFLDEVKIYAFNLTEDQVKAEYAGGAAVLGEATIDFINQGLLGYWKMDEDQWDGTEGEIIDSSGNAANGTSQNATVGLGKFGNSGNFDGDGDYTNASGVSPGQSDFTVAAWIKTTSEETQGITSYDGTSRFRFALATTGRLRYGVYGDTSWVEKTDSTGPQANDGQWHHLAISFDRDGNATSYIDGRAIETLDISSKSSTNISGQDFVVGYDAFIGDSYFSGNIDEVRVYNRVLSESEIYALYGWAPGPSAYWKLDEGGWENDCSTDTVFDSTTNAFNGISCPSSTGPTGNEVGKFGNAGGFDGVDDWVNLGDESELRLNNNKSATFTAWVKTNGSIPTQNILRYDDNDNSDGDTITTRNFYLLSIDSTGPFRFAYGPNTAHTNVYSTTEPEAGIWYHVAAVRDVENDVNRIYVNGVLEATETDTTTGTWETTGQYLQMGRWDDGVNPEYFYGAIDEVKVYNYVRTNSQIIEDMNASASTQMNVNSSLVSWWKFDEHYGDTAYDYISNNNANLDGSCPGDASCPEWSTDGIVNGSLSFSDTKSATVDTSTSINFSTADSFSVCLNFYLNDGEAADGGYLIDNNESDGGEGYSISYSSSGAEFRIEDANGSQTSVASSSLENQRWYHICGVRNTSEDKILLYLDGALADSTLDTTEDTLANSESMTFGVGAQAEDSSDYLNGFLDEIKIYSSPLSREQVLVDKNGGNTVDFGSTVNLKANLIDEETRGPVGYWDFNEKVSGDSQTVFDKSGNGNDGTTSDGNNDSGMNCATTGKYGSACEFDSNDDSVNVGNDSILNPSDEITITTWIYPESGSTCGEGFQGIVGKGTSSYLLYRYDADGSCSIRFRVLTENGANIASIFPPPEPGKWYHLTATFNSSQISIYLNGLLRHTVNHTGSIPSDTANTLIGNWLGNTWNGKIDEVKIFDYALSPSQIAYEYNKGEPIGWYKFDECSGTTAYNYALDGSGSAVGADIEITVGNGGQITDAGECDGDSDEAWASGVEGKFNGSLALDGTDDYAVAEDLDTFNSLTSFSTSAWFKPSSLNATQTIIHKSISHIYLDEDNIISSNFGGSQCSSGIEATEDWYHAAITYDATTLRLYVNGNLAAECARSSNTGTGDIIIGATSTPSNYFDGQVDDVRVYNYTLSAKQITNIINGGAIYFGE